MISAHSIAFIVVYSFIVLFIIPNHFLVIAYIYHVILCISIFIDDEIIYYAKYFYVHKYNKTNIVYR